MKKIVLSAITLLVATQTINAGIVNRTFGAAEDLTQDALNVPGEVLGGPVVGPDYYDDGSGYGYGSRRYYGDGYERHGLLGHPFSHHRDNRY